MKDPRQIIKRPLVTEKASDAREIDWYVFSVDKRSNKIEIRDAVEKLFDVKVLSVRSTITAGKTKRVKRSTFKAPSRKKAYVEVKQGQKIEFFKGV